eukprot:m.157041 g.157041  ORF g.157041 m.157041 type:complete len:352 (+) comp31038_c0_seq2:1155-2210(+)
MVLSVQLLFFVVMMFVPVSDCDDASNNKITQNVFGSTTKTFSITHKPGQGIHPNEPLTIANYTARTQHGNHAVLISWFTGSIPWLGFGDVVIAYYVDGETEPSIKASINLLTGYQGGNSSGDFRSKLVPFGNAELGRAAVLSGYNTIRIPFSCSIVVTATLADYDTESHSLYSLIRGLESYGPIALRYSGLQLPPAVRLRGIAVTQNLESIEWATIANLTTGPGAILFVAQHVRSQNAFCLEGIHMAEVDGEQLQLSSGFEDYYLSGQYFDAGEFATPLSGMTTENHCPRCPVTLYPNNLAAYRFHEADPVVFQNNLTLKWRNGLTPANKTNGAGKTMLESLVLAYVTPPN